MVAYHEGSAFYGTLLKERCKGKVEVTQRQERWGKQLLDDLKEMREEDTGHWKRNRKIALSGELALEEAMYLS